MILATDCVFFVVVILATTTAITDRQVVTVETDVGTINGYVKETTFLDKTVAIDRFQGIPFAEAPVGERRFQKPFPKAPFSEPLDAFAHGNMCMQLSPFDEWVKGVKISDSEDCLYLNIYAPHSRNSRQESLAVMVWIYGGGFNFGFSDIYLGDNIAAHGNVIVVTLNYRLSLWGFLSTGNENAPGNAGLWDQHLGIKWVHDNIAAFGGDNQRITVFGESAGSASVMYQALYPGNKGLFHRVIGQSGSVGSYWASNENVPKFTQYLATLTDCSNDDSKALVACLQGVSNDVLAELVSNVSTGLFDVPFPFSPIEDGDFITYAPMATFSEALGSNDLSPDNLDMFQSVDIMTGVNSGEGSIGMYPQMGIEDNEAFLPSRDDFEKHSTSFLVNKLYSNSNIQLLSDLVAAEYTNWENPNDPINIRQQYVDMHGDAAFLGTLYETVNKHAQVSSATSTYMYMFDEQPTTPFFTNTTWFRGLAHAEDLPFVFGYKSLTDEEDLGVLWEKLLAKDIMTLWTNFAKTG